MLRAAGIATAGLLLCLGAWFAAPDHSPQRAETGLFTSLPILWGEATSPTEQLALARPHWAAAAIAAGGRIRPLDLLVKPDGSSMLGGLTDLVIAQPRALTPLENVALDQWVRGGGHLLLFADPALTANSRFALGDPRRPQDVALLSPILHRWGLELQFDDSQLSSEREQPWAGIEVPVELAGRFAIVDPAACRGEGDGLIARCRIGRGQVVAVADAAVLDRNDPQGRRQRALDTLLKAAFDPQ